MWYTLLFFTLKLLPAAITNLRCRRRFRVAHWDDRWWLKWCWVFEDVTNEVESLLPEGGRIKSKVKRRDTHNYRQANSLRVQWSMQPSATSIRIDCIERNDENYSANIFPWSQRQTWVHILVPTLWPHRGPSAASGYRGSTSGLAAGRYSLRISDDHT
jgi:hypothetical protein